ncbi:ABC transporter permease subunit [Aeromicrobium sp. YIM 150415]|uniref:ABC transporter permease subunit n=1 Tax=Aeromicrobium piscarium TaxID=2590901 RepID=A0A554SGE2_9ACTN|nr:MULTISPECIES: ABC transporter permease subunit [Aeromicrobium]MBM9462746.1 ABC transporter permease subunit [Aeromicrobium sp. YIM 150415]TSD65415.1 ABC transporter permease subunit [Aeromicrobium piscarium]
MTQPAVTIDTQRPGIPFARLSLVEFRKSFDTRAGRWFTISILILAFAAMLIQTFLVPAGAAQDLNDMALVQNSLLGIFVAIIPILLVTQEWGQRTALVTFSLEPRRGRVVLAKLVASALVVLGVLVISVLIALLGTALAGGLRGIEVDWNLSAQMLRNIFIGNAIATLLGFGIALLLMNTPAAIVTYFVYMFVVPTVLNVAGAFLDWFADIVPWIDFASAQEPLLDSGGMSGEEWAQLATSSLLWVGVPLAFGIWRWLRTEVK